MLKARTTLAALSAVVMLGVVPASSSAAAWFANGTELKTSAALTTTASVDHETTINVPSLPLTIKCSGTTLELGVHELFPNGALRYIAHAWLSCAVAQPTTCALSSTTINGEPATGSLATATAPQDITTNKPTTGKVFAEIAFTGASCPVLGTQALTGSVTERLPTGQTESAVQAIEDLGSTDNNSLELDKNKAYFEGGRALLKLVSGLKWSFH